MSCSTRRGLALASVLLAPLFLTACGGGGSAATPTNVGPTAAITAPANNAVVVTANVIVTGTAADADGVASVTVNGVAATSANGFATWTATVPLVAGANTLTVAATDALGASTPNAASRAVTRDTAAPTVAVVFPPVASLTTGSNIIVRGNATDDTTIAGVTVGGVAATSTDGFATWTATVPVAAFAGAVTAVATDAVAQTSGAATVPTVSTVSTFIHRPTFIDFDASNSSILQSDNSYDGVVRTFASGGSTSVYSGPSNGTGPRITTPGDLVKGSGAVYVVENHSSTANAIIRVDATTRARSVISSSTVGSGPAIHSIFAVGYDTTRGLILVGDVLTGAGGFSQILTVDPATGARTLVSGNGTGTGPTIGSFTSITHDSTNDRYIYSDSSSVVAVAIATGDRTTLASPSVGGGAAITSIRDVVLASGTVAYVLRMSPTTNVSMSGTLLHLDLTNGARTTVDLSGVGTLPTLRSARTLARDPANGELFIGDSHAGRIYGVALSSAAVASTLRTVAGDGVRIGSGPELLFPQKLALDLTNNRAYVTDLRHLAVASIDLATGARSFVTGQGIGTGTAFLAPYNVSLDAANNRLLVVDQAYGVFAVSLADGARTLLYDDSTNFYFSTVDDALLDPTRNRLLVTVGNQVPSDLYAIDLTTGAITIAATDGAPAPAIGLLGALTLRTDTDRLLITDYLFSLYQMHPVDGSRSLVHAGTLPAASVAPISGVATDNTSAWVVNGQYNSIERVTLATGAATTVFDGATSAVPGSSNIGGVGIDATRKLLYWVDPGMHGLTVVDGITGERVIISR